jgi:hypothetical protein
MAKDKQEAKQVTPGGPKESDDKQKDEQQSSAHPEPDMKGKGSEEEKEEEEKKEEKEEKEEEEEEEEEEEKEEKEEEKEKKEKPQKEQQDELQNPGGKPKVYEADDEPGRDLLSQGLQLAKFARTVNEQFVGIVDGVVDKIKSKLNKGPDTPKAEPAKLEEKDKAKYDLVSAPTALPGADTKEEPKIKPASPGE